MATPRKHWFKVADSVLREEWSNDTLATHVRLMAWLNQRWARDGIEHEKAGSAVIGGFDAMAITGVKRAHVALQRLASHPLVAGLTSARASLVGVCPSSGALLENTQSPTAVLLEWSKFSEFQEYGSRLPPGDDPGSRPHRAPPVSGSDSVPISKKLDTNRVADIRDSVDVPPEGKQQRKPWPGTIPRSECKLPEFPPDEFPGFEARPLRFYAELAAPAGNGGGQQHTTEEAAKWHAWQFHTQGLANAKPRGMTLAIKNRWRRLGEFHGGPNAELRKAADWYSSVRFAKRKRALIAESEAKPEVELNYVEKLALGID